MRELLHVHPGASLPHIVMLRAGDDPGIELFKYRSPTASTGQPYGDDPGATHVAFYTDDIYASVAALRFLGVKVLTDPIVNRTGPTAGETWVYFETPWGSRIKLVTYPQDGAYEKKGGAVPLWHAHRVATAAGADLVKALAQRYVTMLAETDQAGRLGQIQAAYSADCRVVDRDSVVVGQLALNALVGSLQRGDPGSASRWPDVQVLGHGVALVRWHLGPRDGTGPVVGHDILVVRDGRISETIRSG